MKDLSNRLYVLGHPVAHSKSPAMHNAAYKALGINWEYGLADCPTLDDARAFLDKEQWLAINITMPYKPLALSYAHQAMPEAQLAGGANVLIHAPQGLWADNTDGRGCISYLRRCGIDFQGASVVVCGTGPTSMAIMYAAARAGAVRVALLGRNAVKARQALDGYFTTLGTILGMECSSTLFQAGSYEECDQVIAEADIVLDATPLGMKQGDPAPFDTSLLNSGQVLFDVVYGHGTTALLSAAHEKGCRAFNGAGMLVAQAVETVYDLVDVLSIPVDPRSVDLFEIMAEAAGFDLA